MLGQLRTSFICAIGTLLLPQLHAHAQSNNANHHREATCELRLSLDSFRAHALAHSPLVAEIDRDYAALVARAIETELPANPELSGFQTWTSMYVGGANDAQSEVGISQPLRISNFGKRDKVGALIRKSGNTERSIKLLELSQQLNIEFVRLYTLQETLRVLTQAERDATRRVATVTKLVKEGLISAGSEAIFQGERARIEAQLIAAEGNLATLDSDLANTIGTSCRIVATAPPKSTTIKEATALISAARSSAMGENARLQVARDLSYQQSLLAQLDAVPVISPRVVYQHTNDGGDFVGAGLTIPIPVWNRNQGEITRTEAERNAARIKSELSDTGGLELRITRAHTAALSAQRQVEIYNTQVVPAFRSALSAEERAYASGKGSMLEVWQTVRALNEAQLTALTLMLQAAAVRARLSVLIGEEI